MNEDARYKIQYRRLPKVVLWEIRDATTGAHVWGDSASNMKKAEKAAAHSLRMLETTGRLSF